MKPTLGRLVWYRPRGYPAGTPEVNLGAALLPAIIVNVFGDGHTGRVDLQVFANNHRGVYWEPGVMRGEGPGEWQWPEVGR